MSETILLLGNCLETLKDLPDNSVDSVVTDPPYGLSFMGKKWDYDVPSIEIWKEVLRVLKPGGHLLSFGGTRTYHRMVVAIEDAGFEIRDQLQWLYGSGFPKSHDISKAIDKAAGAERELIGTKEGMTNLGSLHDDNWIAEGKVLSITAPSTPEAKQWQGWGTALKPANEPIVLARKPLEHGHTIAQNVLKHGVGGLNIDATRIEGAKPSVPQRDLKTIHGGNFGAGVGRGRTTEMSDNSQGRWPANIILDEVAAEMLDEQSGDNVSRFFYVAKASKRERGEGNVHPTVKPVKLMEYLIKLITPPDGIVLDPFMGSGTTGVAAKNLDFDFIGCEMSNEYMEIADKRINAKKIS